MIPYNLWRVLFLQAVSKTLTVDELSYLKEQFELLEPNKNGFITLETIKMVGSLSLSLFHSQHVHSNIHKNEIYGGNLLLSSYFGQGLAKHATDAMNESRTLDFLANVTFCFFSLYLDQPYLCMLTKLVQFLLSTKLGLFPLQLNTLQYRGMDFEEFCAAALSIHQLEALDRWEQHARCAYEIFEKNGNRAIVIEELASVS